MMPTNNDEPTMIELKPVAIPVQEPAQEPVQEVNVVTPAIVEQTKPIVVSEEDDIESGHSKKTESENKEGMAEGVEGMTPAYRTKQANIATTVGLAVNVLLTVCKYIMGVMGNSSAMVADAIHSCTDLVTDFVALAVMSAAKKPADKDHPYGHGRYEIAGSVFIALMLIGAGAFVGYEGIAKLISREEQLVEYIALLAAVISIVAKELLFWYTYWVGKRINSPVIIANAWHHRSDAISSVVALIGIGLNIWLKWWWADPVASLGVALMIIFIGGKIGYESICSLSDKISTNTMEELNSILKSVECEGYSNLRAREMGPFLIVDVTLFVHAGTHVEDCESISREAIHKIKEEMPSVSEVLVHVQPLTDDEPEAILNRDNFTSKIRQTITQIPGFGKIEQIRVFGPAPYSVDLHISADGSQSPTQQIKLLKEVKQSVSAMEGIGETHISIENVL